jgi:hypothetical protein
MLQNMFEDLRFFIGTFFAIIGAILLFQGVVHPTQVEGLNLNLICGVSFLVFAGGALGLSVLAHRKP